MARGPRGSDDRTVRYEEISQLFGLDPHHPAPGTLRLPPGAGEDFGRVEEDFGSFLDESLDPRGKESLYDLVARAGLPRGAVAVDVGCGSGRDCLGLARTFGLHVHGVDPVPANIERARSRAAADGLEHLIDLQVGSAESIPLSAESVDLLWCKEVLVFTDLDAAMGEVRRILRPKGVAILYQVLIGPAMGEDEARWFSSQEMGFGPARSLRPADLGAAIEAAGLVVRERVDFASEWGEAGQEREGAAGKRLVHAARLLRQPERYVERYGEVNYRIMLADCLWHVYRMIGKLWGVAFVVGRS